MSRLRTLAAWLAVGAVAAALVAAHRRGDELDARPGLKLFLGWPPFHHVPDPRWSWLLVITTAGALAGAAVVVSDRPRWSTAVAGGVILSAAWTVLLAASDGWGAVSAQLSARDDYLAQLPWVRENGWRAYFESFGDESLFSTFPTHVRSHPPGMVALLGALDSVGLTGGVWATAVVLAAAATIPVSVGVTVKRLAGPDAARWAIALSAFTPAVVFLGSTADALFAAVAAGAIATGLAAIDRASWPLSIVAGLLGAAAVSLTYGVIPLVASMWVGALLRSRSRTAVAMSGAMVAAILAAIAVWAMLGFNWFDGFDAVRRQYELDAAQRNRPFDYFVWANLVVFACVCGPAVVAGLTAVRRDRLWWLVAPALGALAIADASGLSKAEVERIWLPFVPWVTVAGVWLLGRLSPRGRWVALAAQIATGVALQSLLFGPW